jgi:signal transduction histidine kinase
VTAILVFRVGGLGPQAAMVYPPLVLMAGLVWSRRAAVGMALLVSAAGFLLAALEDSGVLPAPQPSSPWQLWLVMSGCVVVTAALIRFGLGIIIRAAKERRMLEERLREAQRVDSLGRLAGGVAHDFNNLLTVILASADLLEPDLPRGSREVQSIRDAATRAAGLTRQLLAFGRRQVLVAEAVELGQAMQDARPLLERLLHEEVRLELRPASAAACCIVVDRSQLQLVVMNLVVNARDAMPRGGVVTLEWGAGRPPAKSVPEFEGPGAWIAVRDTGSGIAPEIRSRVFEPFFTTKGGAGGTGLGLSMVYGFARQSGGVVTLESQVDRGTIVRIFLPIVKQAAV